MSVFEKVKQAILELDPTDQAITKESKFKEDLGLDSLDAIELAMRLEEEYVVELDDDELDGTETVGQLVTMIESKVNGSRN
jgi:acyl carrier protein